MSFPLTTTVVDLTVTYSAVSTRWCADCGDETPFEAPPCLDGHGDDCPDLMCVDCGAGVVVGLLLVEDEVLLQAA